MKIAILYVSQSGNTEKAAGFIRDGMTCLHGIEVKLMNLSAEETLDTQYLKDSAAVVFGTPTYVANMAWQLKKWFDTDRSVSLAGKLGAAFATANFVHGGPGIALEGILQHLLVKGMVVYSSGGAFGMPIIHLGPVAIASEMEKTREIFVTFGQRIAEKTLELFGAK
jgi:NAD(P)H dehydrogenase (quinone)